MPEPLEIRVRDTIRLSETLQVVVLPPRGPTTSDPMFDGATNYHSVLYPNFQRGTAAVAVLDANQPIPELSELENSALSELERATPRLAPDENPVARMAETDWLDSASLFLPKSIREALLGDLLEERASWRAEGKSRLSVARWTVSQLILSVLALVWSATKDLITEIIKRCLGI